MRATMLAAVACFAMALTAGKAQANLIGGSVDVQFSSLSQTVDFGSVTLEATPAVFDTAYGYVTVSASQISISVPSYVTHSFSYGIGSAFIGFIFTYGAGATVTSDSFDPASAAISVGLLNLYPEVGVNLVNDVLHAGQPVLLDMVGTFDGPIPTPEPNTLAMLLSAFAGVIGARAGHRPFRGHRDLGAAPIRCMRRMFAERATPLWSRRYGSEGCRTPNRTTRSARM